MPRASQEDDLFRSSTMTFGEHLGELRTRLFKAVLGLAFGFILGLTCGTYVVEFIATPLTHALDRYVKNDSVSRVEAVGGERPLPWTSNQVKERVNEEGLLAEEVSIDLTELVPQLKAAFPEQLGTLAWPPRAQSAMPGDASSRPKNGDGGPGEATAQTQGPTIASEKSASKENDQKNLIRLFLWHPSKNDPRLQIKSMGTQEAFVVYIKASLLVGVLGASPWIFYQIWAFVAAGLYPHERRYVQTYLPFSIGLFLVGAALAFFVVFEPVLNFLLHFNHALGVDPVPRLNEWLSFVLILPVGFGIGFQLPLVMLFMERIGIFTAQSYLKQWRIAVLAIFAMAALLTPPDATSMIMLAGSLTILYFGGILLCKLWPRPENPFEPSR